MADSIGHSVRRIRRMRGMAQQELAKRAGTTQYTVSEIELGHRDPHPSTLRKLADALGVEVAVFFQGGTESPKASAPSAVEPTLWNGLERERRFDEIDRLIGLMDRRAQAWEQQAAAEDNPFLTSWQAAVAWDELVSKEAFTLFEAAEEAARPLMPEGVAQGIDAHELADLEEAYSRLWAASTKVTAVANAAVDRTAKEVIDRAAEERRQKFEVLQGRLSA